MNTLKNHSNNYHLLRHVAAFFVLYAHAATVNGTEEFLFHYLKGRIELSSLGVQVFFIISGYLVTQSLITTKNRWQFARKRWLRLWPALFVVTSLLCFFMGPIVSSLSASSYFRHPQTWYFLVRNSLFLPVYQLPGVFNGQAINSTFWTLFFEMACYVVLLILGKNALLRYRKPITIFWVLVMLFKYFFPPIIHWPAVMEPYLYGINDMVFLFFTAAIWLLHTTSRSLPSKTIYLVALAVFITTTLVPLPSYFKWMHQLSLLLFIIEWGRSKPVIKWPSWDISYGTYLLGFSVEMLVVHYFLPQQLSAPLVFLFTTGITVPLAFCLWYGVEKPALRRK